MRLRQYTLTIPTRGRGPHELTAEVQRRVAESGVDCGLCQLFIQHTSASLAICENAASEVRDDTATFLERLAPDGAPWYTHTDEGPDDMAAHLRSLLTEVSLTLPVSNGRCALGTWQGIYLWEHRTARHQRRVVMTIWGE